MKRRTEEKDHFQKPKRKLRQRYHSDNQQNNNGFQSPGSETSDELPEVENLKDGSIICIEKNDIKDKETGIKSCSGEKQCPGDDDITDQGVESNYKSKCRKSEQKFETLSKNRLSSQNSPELSNLPKMLIQGVKNEGPVDTNSVKFQNSEEMSSCTGFDKAIHRVSETVCDDEESKDNGSIYSESDTCDRNYKVNVSLYGTDIDEDSNTDERSVPLCNWPDKNNNQPLQKLQFNGDTQQLNNLKARVDLITAGSLLDEGSNTVDGFTRRALESQCIITDIQPGGNDLVQPEHRKQSFENQISSTSTGVLKEDAQQEKNMTLQNQEAGDNNARQQLPLSFGEVFKEAVSEENVDNGITDHSDHLHESFGNNYSQQQLHHCKPSTSDIISPRFGMTARPGVMPSPLAVDENMAAEQIASELVQTYSGENSHMISDILRRRADGHFDSTGQRVVDQRQFEDLTAAQTVIHDVDLLNTPQQLPPVESDFNNTQCYIQEGSNIPHTYRNPNTQLTPEACRQIPGRQVPPQLHGRITYNDIQVYGGKWSANRQETVTHSSYSQEYNENPFPNGNEQVYRNSYPLNNGTQGSPSQQYINSYPPQGSTNNVQAPSNWQPAHNDYRQFNFDTHTVKPHSGISPQVYSGNHLNNQMRSVYPPSPDPLGLWGAVGNCPRPSHEVTKMTYTPKNVMESHLSQNSLSHKSRILPNQPLSDVDYSSIYPPRDYINKPLSMESLTPKKFPEDQARITTYDKQQPPRKRYKQSKYDQIPQRAPPMPIIDDMISKYPPSFSKETEPLSGRHKYVVVNPSSVTEMAPKALLIKYIDFLILENEQVTDISQSPGAPEDIYVTEDMYFMDTLKNRIPFPSKRFTDWAASFFPKLDVSKMKFKGKCPDPSFMAASQMSDPRPTQQILEDTFYFFQRTVMNMEG